MTSSPKFIVVIILVTNQTTSMKKYFSTLLLFIFVYCLGFSQNLPGKTVTIYSTILQESRKIQIYSPAQPGSKNITYPVLYVFDAESLFLSVVAATQFMYHGSSLPQMPEAIIVGIYNTNRDRDMPVPQEIDSTMGAANFLKFLTKELLPFINKNYPVNKLNTLVGHSQGGLFVTYAGLSYPQLFSFVLSLDAPMTVNKSLLRNYQQKMSANCLFRYFSAESLYGWSNNFAQLAGCNSYRQQKIDYETHETMPYKGIYDGLKFLFNEYIPPQSGMSLEELEKYYENLSIKNRCNYEIPRAVLLAAARQYIGVFKKENAINLITYCSKKYGADKQVSLLLAKAKAIILEPDPRVDFYLKHPGSTANSLKPFMGKWEGKLVVPGGEDMNFVWEIKMVDGKYVLDTRVIDEFNIRSDFLLVTDNGELAWGRKHNNGGIYLSKGKLSVDGRVINGSEDIIGIPWPEGAPPFQINTFTFIKKGE